MKASDYLTDINESSEVEAKPDTSMEEFEEGFRPIGRSSSDNNPLVSDQEVEDWVNSRPIGTSITKDFLESRIKTIEYFALPNGRSILCVITLDNGFITEGLSHAASGGNFKEEIGKKVAYDIAFDKLWMPFGFFLREALHLKNCKENMQGS